MKIVNRKEFLSLPAGTLFAKYAPCCFESINIKGETLTSNDFLSSELFTFPMFGESCAMMELGESVDIETDCLCRDGLFDDEQLFAVFENSDIEKLIAKLKELKNGR